MEFRFQYLIISYQFRLLSGRLHLKLCERLQRG